MNEIQRLPVGSRIRLRGGGSARVAENPRDGAWLIAAASGLTRGLAADTPHGMAEVGRTPEGESLLVVHAEDIIAALP